MFTALISGLIAAIVSIVFNLLTTRLQRTLGWKFFQTLDMKKHGRECGRMKALSMVQIMRNM